MTADRPPSRPSIRAGRPWRRSGGTPGARRGRIGHRPALGNTEVREPWKRVRVISRRTNPRLVDLPLERLGEPRGRLPQRALPADRGHRSSGSQGEAGRVRGGCEASRRQPEQLGRHVVTGELTLRYGVLAALTLRYCVLLARPWGRVTPRRRSTLSSSSGRTITGRAASPSPVPIAGARSAMATRASCGAPCGAAMVRRRARGDESAAGGRRRTPVRDLRAGPVRERGRDMAPRGVDSGGGDPPYAHRVEGRSRGRVSARAPARTGPGAAPGRSPG